MPDDPIALIIKAGQALAASYQELGEHAHVSRRTVQRWITGESWPAPHQLQMIAVAVHPRDPVIAQRLAAAGGRTLESLGLVPAKALEAGRRPSPTHLDAVICAAAEVLDISPRAVRPALAVAFARAHELGFDTAAFSEGFAASKPASAAFPAKKPAKG
jgi:hypothetical protein